MLKLQGIAVSPGVTIGEALVLDAEGFRIPRRFVERSAVDTELERLKNAVAQTTRDIERNRDAIRAEVDLSRRSLGGAWNDEGRPSGLLGRVGHCAQEIHHPVEPGTARAHASLSLFA